MMWLQVALTLASIALTAVCIWQVVSLRRALGGQAAAEPPPPDPAAAIERFTAAAARRRAAGRVA